MADSELHAVTGAFGYSGKHIARRLLDQGHRVITLTNSPHRPNPFGERVQARPLDFDGPQRLVESLRGVSVLHNTYWVRFNHRDFTHADAVRNSVTLFHAAAEAGVKRVVHLSVTNPSHDSPLEYFRGKAEVEDALCESGISHCILRPALFYGPEDILVNNIAWLLRRIPLFLVFGGGKYEVQPIHVDELAALALEQATRRENVTINAVGPETFTYREMVAAIGEAIGKRRRILSVSPRVGLAVGWLVGKVMRDVLITREEIEGLMANLLRVDSPPTGTIRLTDWAREHADSLGRHYASEMARRRDRERAYVE